MKSFVLRIYRYDEGSSGKIVGVVEEVERGVRHSFHTIDELRDILFSFSPERRDKGYKTG